MLETDHNDIQEKPSKTMLRKMAEATSKFVRAISSFSPQQLEMLGLPEEALEIILESKNMKASSGKNRLLKNACQVLRADEVWGTRTAYEQFNRILKTKKGLR